MTASKVPIALYCCKDYSDAQSVIFQMLDDLNTATLFSGKKVLVKVNLMLGASPEQGTNTHPKIAAAIVRYIRSKGGQTDVADSSGALGLTEECFVRSGMAKEIKEAQGGWVNLDAAPMRIARLKGKRLDQIVLPAILDDYDCIVSAAKLKIHTLTGMTGAVKNMMGIVPGAVKPWIHHRHACTTNHLAEALLDIYAAFRPKLSIMDGIICREAGGSTQGRAKRCEILAASTDGLALDACCTDLIGLEQNAVPMLYKGQKRNLGSTLKNDWNVIGNGPRQKGAIPLLPSPYEVKINPLVAFAAYSLRDHAVRPVFLQNECRDCDDCIDSCPTDALKIKGGRIRRNPFRCVGCYRCVYVCPKNIARLKVAWYAKKAFWKKAGGLTSDRFIDTD